MISGAFESCLPIEIGPSNIWISHAVCICSMGATNPASMMPIQQQQQQQHSSQGAFGNMGQNIKNLQPGMVPLQNTPQNHTNFQQQRPQN